MSSSVRVYNTDIGILSNATWAAAQFNSENWDDNSYHSTSSNTSRISFGAAGTFLIIGEMRFAQNTTGQRGLYIRGNGTTDWGQTLYEAIDNFIHKQQVHAVVKVQPGDYIELMMYQNSGSGLSTDGWLAAIQV